MGEAAVRDRAGGGIVSATELPNVEMTLEYPYTRTTGPVIGPFLTGLRDGRILGNRCGGRVLCPPLEYDPDTSEPLEPEFVEVGPGGTVGSWTWVAHPTPKHPFDHPVRVRADPARRRRHPDRPRRRRRVDGRDVDGHARRRPVPRRARRCDHRRVLRARGRCACPGHHRRRRARHDHRAPRVAADQRTALPAPGPVRTRACSRGASSASARRRAARCTSRATATTTSSASR